MNYFNKVIFGNANVTKTNLQSPKNSKSFFTISETKIY